MSSPKSTGSIAQGLANVERLVNGNRKVEEPPKHILLRSEYAWSGRDADGQPIRGMHVIVTEMVLDREEQSGPQYRKVRCVSDVGGPLRNPRKAPDTCGIAWFAIADSIARGRITVVEAAS